MTDVDLELLQGESIMSAVEERIYRQITDLMMDGDKIATTAFGPATIDRDMPSFARASLTSAQQARDWHTNNASRPSLAVYAVTVGEVIEGGRHVIDDSAAPLEDGELRAPAHCFVDYRGLTRPARKALRAHLWLQATERGEIPTDPTLPDGQLIA
ncbi:hypothetical protein C3481_06445 [Microbacterium sp. Ru50]|uniref:hypothetical protein n=1 Tax=Microbacterium sp. Ru50 TaxID=2080744 RepID=UPI000CDD9FDE|nr:hypothetical protein [Microbacterium sp. Ru50]POX67821.1 hypothetical protein C3481_06445 [Microbacterium sp. Ru50]